MRDSQTIRSTPPWSRSWIHALQGIVLFVGVTYGYPLTIMTASLLGTPSRDFTIPYRIAYLCFSVWLLVEHRNTIVNQLRMSPAMRAFTVFWSLYSLRLVFELLSTPASELRLPKSDYIQFAFGGTLVPAVAFALGPRFASSRLLFSVLATAGFLATLTSVFLFRDYLGSDFRRVGGDTSDVAFGSLNTGYLASSIIVIAFYLILERRGPKYLMVGLILMVPATVGIALGATRGSILAVAVCLAAQLVSKVWTGRPARACCVAIALLVAIPHLAAWYSNLGSNLVVRFEVLFAEDQLSEMSRLSIWNDSWKQFLSSPIVGNGIEEQSRLCYPHNIIIESFMTTGVIGGAAFLYFLGGTIRAGFGLLADAAVCRRVGWLALLAFHYMAHSMVSGALYSNVMFWASAVAVVTVHYSLRESCVNTSVERTRFLRRMTRSSTSCQSLSPE